jgi:hypothetical protein
MKIESQELIEEFYEKNRDKFPGLNLDQVKEICYAPFIMTRKEMESGSLATIRLKYLGTFLVYPKRVEATLKMMEKNFKELRIAPKQYFEKKSMIEKYLKSKQDAG